MFMGTDLSEKKDLRFLHPFVELKMLGWVPLFQASPSNAETPEVLPQLIQKRNSDSWSVILHMTLAQMMWNKERRGLRQGGGLVAQ